MSVKDDTSPLFFASLRPCALALRFFARVLVAPAIAAAGSMGTASADEPPRAASSTIAVLCPPGDRFGLRLVAELESLGLTAVVVDPGEARVSRAALEASARRVGAIAAIRAVPAEGGAEVWIADRVTGKTVLRAVPAAPDAAEPDAALALRAVELLRASLLEAALPRAPQGEVPATPEIRAKLDLPAPEALTPIEAPVFRFAFGLGPLLTPDSGLAPAAALDVAFAWMPAEHLGAMLFATIPMSRPGVSATHGSVDLAAGLGGVGMRFQLTSRANRWAPTIDLGMAAVGLQSNGSGHAGFTAGSAFTFTFAPFLRTGLAFAPTPRFRLRADAQGSFGVQDASLQIAGQQAARWGRPALLFTLGADVGLF